MSLHQWVEDTDERLDALERANDHLWDCVDCGAQVFKGPTRSERKALRKNGGAS